MTQIFRFRRSRRCARTYCVGLVVLMSAFAASCAAAGQTLGAQAPCSNETVRAEQAATFLADCRAYELVSPIGAAPFEAQSKLSLHRVEAAQASSTGGAIAWASYYPVAGSEGGYSNLSRRGSGGWTTESIVPGPSTGQAPLKEHFTCEGAVYWSEDLSSGILSAGEDSDGIEGEGSVEDGPEREFCGSFTPSLVAGEPRGFQNLFLTSPGTRSYQLVNNSQVSAAANNARLQDATADLSHIVFAEDAELTAEAPLAVDLYEWAQGKVQLVSVLPDGEPSEGRIAGYALAESEGGRKEASASYTHAVSSDGSRIFFTAGGKLYVRLHADAAAHHGLLTAAECVASSEGCTIQVDESKVSGGAGGGGKFLAANAEGSKVFFVDESAAQLTEDTPLTVGESLYEYDVETGMLRDVTPVSEARVLGLSGISEDGSYLYFAAEGALTPGTLPHRAHLFLWHEGELRLVATFEKNGGTAEEQFDWATPESEVGLLEAEVSPEGTFFAFTSGHSLTGYDNTDAQTGSPDAEIFLYDAADEELACVSCDPDGAQPVGPAAMNPLERLTINGGPGPARLRRNVLGDGAVFFNTPDALAAQDKNETEDVYEYREGQVNLISDGTQREPANFYEASPNGEDVFFITSAALVRRDSDEGLSIYDARTGGGFVEPAEATPCKEEACQGSWNGAAFSSPLSSTFSGPGNAPLSKTPSGHRGKKERSASAKTRARALRACARLHKQAARRACRRRVLRRYARKSVGHEGKGGTGR